MFSYECEFKIIKDYHLISNRAAFFTKSFQFIQIDTKKIIYKYSLKCMCGEGIPPFQSRFFIQTISRNYHSRQKSIILIVRYSFAMINFVIIHFVSTCRFYRWSGIEIWNPNISHWFPLVMSTRVNESNNNININNKNNTNDRERKSTVKPQMTVSNRANKRLQNCSWFHQNRCFSPSHSEPKKRNCNEIVAIATTMYTIIKSPEFARF